MNRIWKRGLGRKGLQWATGALGLLPLGLAVFSVPVFAQIVPDNTLGNESSLITPNVNIRGLPAERIDGGAVRGSALFHSFSEFNVNNGQRVYFSNPAGIADIFSRVTGSNVSNILGTLGVDGGANLFVINPNGILFGPNAQLDIQGSFLATTGSSFKFSDGSEFSATNPQAAPLLSINVTPGVQWGANQPGATITNRGNLSVGQDLTLAAGTLDLQGKLQAGRDLTLFAQDVEAGGKGNAGLISIQADSLSITNGAGLQSLVRQASNDQPAEPSNGGKVDINVQGAVTISGKGNQYTSLISTELQEGRVGRGGDINITSGSLLLQDGTQLRSSTFGQGNGGDIKITALNSVTLSISGQLLAETKGSGQAGNVEITTPTLNVNGGAKVSTTTTSTVNTGTGGDITVKVNTLNLSGADRGLLAETRGAANAGNLTLNPYSGNDLQVNFAEGAKVSASTSGSGRGGSLKVTARTYALTN